MPDDFQALPPAHQDQRDLLPARKAEKRPGKWNFWWLVLLTAIVAFAYVSRLDFHAEKPLPSPVVAYDDCAEPQDISVAALQGMWTANVVLVDCKKEPGEVKVSFCGRRFAMAFAGKTYEGRLEPEPSRVLFTGNPYRVDLLVSEKPRFYDRLSFLAKQAFSTSPKQPILASRGGHNLTISPAWRRIRPEESR